MTVATALLASAAHAQDLPPTTLLKAGNPAGIAAYLQQMGYRAKVSADKSGDPKIDTRMGGYSVSIYFYGCEKNVDCTSIQFQTGVATRKKLTLAQVNAFNSKKRFSQLSLDEEQDPWLYYDLPTGKAGITGDAFALAAEVYEDQLNELSQMIDQAGAGN
jgi:hypothetical protein